MIDTKAENARDDIPPQIRETGSMAGMLAALTVLVLVAVAAFWLIGTHGTTAAAPGMTIAVEAAPTTSGAAPKPGAARVER